MAVANPGGITSLDPVNDLHLKGVDVVEASMRLRVLRESLREFNCIHSPTFDMQVCVDPMSDYEDKTPESFILPETVQTCTNVPLFLLSLSFFSGNCIFMR